MQLNMQASPIGMASASQADFGGFDSRRLLHVSWIKMLSTAKTSENISFSEVFCCFSGKNGTFTHPQNRFRFCAVF